MVFTSISRSSGVQEFRSADDTCGPLNSPRGGGFIRSSGVQKSRSADDSPFASNGYWLLSPYYLPLSSFNSVLIFELDIDITNRFDIKMMYGTK